MDVSPSGGGIVEIDQNAQSSYPASVTLTNIKTIRLEAVPAPGYRFNNWSGDLSGTTNPTTIVTGCNKKITANFSQIKPSWWLVGGIIAGVIIIGVIIWLKVRGGTARSTTDSG